MRARLLAAAILVLAAARVLPAQTAEPRLDAYEDAVRAYLSGGDLT